MLVNLRNLMISVGVVVMFLWATPAPTDTGEAREPLVGSASGDPKAAVCSFAILFLGVPLVLAGLNALSDYLGEDTEDESLDSIRRWLTNERREESEPA